ncbi:MAG TPA: YraN family protein [Solirubrobacteraceae bacterium]|jgi:putative endonuclease
MSQPPANQRLGRLGEQLALEHYERLGFMLLTRNHWTRAGEIDLIVHDRDSLVFVEVKTRRSGGLDPLFGLTVTKRRRMRTLAATWLAEHPDRPRVRSLRIDAVAVLVNARDELVALEQIEDVA